MTRHHRLEAEFFVDQSGIVFSKARPLHGSERRRIFDRDGRKCAFCDRPLKLFKAEIKFLDAHALAHVDHVIPRARGGQNNDGNLRLLCEACNESRGADV